ncbi:hypothetical protein UlMin_023327 [Ulmus minor]
MSWTSSNASNTSHVTLDPSNLRDLGMSWTSSNASNTSHVTVDPSNLRDLGMSWTLSNASNTSHVTVDPSNLRDLGMPWTSSNASNTSHVTLDPSNLRDLGMAWTSSNASNTSHVTLDPSKLRDLGMSWTSSNASNSSHITVDSSNLQDFSMSSTSSNASNTSMQVLQLSSLVEDMKVEKNEEEEKCNIFEGKWVYDPKGSPAYYGSQCPFLGEKVRCQKNGRPDSEYEKWSWEAKGCKIPRYNGKDMLEKLRGKRVIIVGDSLNRNQWESLACLLYSSLSPSQTHVEVHSGHYRLFKAKEYDCSVEFYWSPFIVKLEVNKANGDRILNLDKLPAVTKKWKGADFMVFNTGHWWVHTGKLRAWDLFRYGGKSVKEMEIESALGMAMKTWARWINQNVDTTKTRGRQWCYNESQPITDESYIKIFPAKIIQTVERTIHGMKTPVAYLNITKLSEYRRDGHPSIYRTKDGKTMVATRQKQPKTFADCSHWCLPGLPDTWNRLLFASILLETPKNISTS